MKFHKNLIKILDISNNFEDILCFAALIGSLSTAVRLVVLSSALYHRSALNLIKKTVHPVGSDKGKILSHPPELEKAACTK